MRAISKTVFCVASGPSLTKEDCQLIANSGASVVAVNSTWTMFDDLYALYAGDLAWWAQNNESVPRDKFRLICASSTASAAYGLEYKRYCERGEGYNSGAMAIEFAIEEGAEQIILIGYDCSLSHGTHWHGDHRGTLKNPTSVSIGKWQKHFERIQAKYPDTKILNASRRTELKCFPLTTQEKAIAALS